MNLRRRFLIILVVSVGALGFVLYHTYNTLNRLSGELHATMTKDLETGISEAIRREQGLLVAWSGILRAEAETESFRSDLFPYVDFVAMQTTSGNYRVLWSTLGDSLGAAVIRRIVTSGAAASDGFVVIDDKLLHVNVSSYRMNELRVGSMIAARAWDSEVLERLHGEEGTLISIIPPGDYRPIRKKSPDAVSVRKPLTFINGEVAAFLEVSTDMRRSDAALTTVRNNLVAEGLAVLLIVCLLGYFVFKWVISPLRIISHSLNREVVGDLHTLKEQSSEFGLISKRLTKFFVQRSALLKELEWHQKTERALKQSEQDYRELFERAHDAILIIDADNENIIAANEGARFVYDIESGPGEIRKLSDVWPDAAAREKLLTQASQQGWEVTLRKADGREYVLEVSSSPVEYQRRQAVMCIGRDITDRKYYEELRLSQTVLRQVNNLIMVGNSTGRVIYVNHAVTTLTGYNRSELLGHGWWRVTRDNDNDRQSEMQYIMNAAKGSTPAAAEPYERRILCKNGKSLWIQWYDAKGPEDLIIGVGIDITAQRQALQALEESEEHYRLLFDNNPNAIIMYDAASYSIIDVNPAACKLYKYDRDDFLELRIHDIMVSAERETMAGEGPKTSMSMTTRHVRKDGTVLDVDVVDHVIEYGNRPARIAMMHELSERKRAELAELELRTQKIRLATVVQTQEEERRRIARELHDGLGQMLAALKRNLEYESFHDVKQTATSSAGLLDSAIGETRRIAHNLMPSALEDLGLFAALDRLCYQSFNHTDVKINFQTYSFDDRLPPASELNLYRIVQEAFNNIVKHAEASEVTLQIVGHKNRLVITIEDDGVGFDSGETSRRKNKSGFGLINLKERVEFLGGDFEINSAPGQGTSLVIEIPIVRQVEHV